MTGVSVAPSQITAASHFLSFPPSLLTSGSRNTLQRRLCAFEYELWESINATISVQEATLAPAGPCNQLSGNRRTGGAVNMP